MCYYIRNINLMCARYDSRSRDHIFAALPGYREGQCVCVFNSVCGINKKPHAVNISAEKFTA